MVTSAPIGRIKFDDIISDIKSLNADANQRTEHMQNEINELQNMNDQLSMQLAICPSFSWMTGGIAGAQSDKIVTQNPTASNSSNNRSSVTAKTTTEKPTDDEPQKKKSKTDNIDDPTDKKTNAAECHFTVERKNDKYETKKRPPTSKIGETCSGDLVRLEKITKCSHCVFD